jgi:membrane dipeptidase
MNYFDFHADTLTEMESGTLQNNQNDIDLKRINQMSGNYVQVFAIWKDVISVKNKEEEFEQLYRKAIDLLTQEKASLELCLAFGDMEKALQSGKAAAFLAIEDISLMGSYVEKVRELGFRFAILTWNYENEYAYGAVANQNRGLKPQGRELVHKLLQQNIILDISHLSDAGAEEIFEITDKPIIASHSNVRDICNQPRNLRREHIREIIARNGVIGMNLYRPFVGEGTVVTVQDLFRHMDAILTMGGEDALVLGEDFDGCQGLFPEHITGVESVPYIREQMECAGFDRRLIDKVLFENGYQFIKRNLRGENND